MFGSVPLRAVLPDGDIDISVFAVSEGNGSQSSGGSSTASAGSEPEGGGGGGGAGAGAAPPPPPAAPLRDTWASQLLRALEREASRPDAAFKIRDVQIIQAEVRREGAEGGRRGTSRAIPSPPLLSCVAFCHPATCHDCHWPCSPTLSECPCWLPLTCLQCLAARHYTGSRRPSGGTNPPLPHCTQPPPTLTRPFSILPAGQAGQVRGGGRGGGRLIRHRGRPVHRRLPGGGRPAHRAPAPVQALHPAGESKQCRAGGGAGA